MDSRSTTALSGCVEVGASLPWWCECAVKQRREGGIWQRLESELEGGVPKTTNSISELVSISYN